MRPKSMVLILIALACGLVASIAISQVVDSKSGQQESVQTAPVYVASIDVPIQDRLTASSVRLEEWPIERIPPGAISKLEDIDGRKPTAPLYAGEVILSARLVDPNSRAMTSERIPKGHRVVSVKVQMDSAVSGLLSPGDRVDVLCYFPNHGVQQTASTKTILTDITVFAINDRISRIANEDDEGMPEAKTVSLTVTPKQAQKLLLAAELGQIKLSLRSNEDDGDEVPETTGLEDLAPGGRRSSDLFNAASVSQYQPAAPPAAGSETTMQVVSPVGTETYRWDSGSSLPKMVDQQQAGGLTLPTSTTLPQMTEDSGNSAEEGGRPGDPGGFDFDSLDESGSDPVAEALAE